MQLRRLATMAFAALLAEALSAKNPKVRALDPASIIDQSFVQDAEKRQAAKEYRPSGCAAHCDDGATRGPQ